jgi:hypothetical protein
MEGEYVRITDNVVISRGCIGNKLGAFHYPCKDGLDRFLIQENYTCRVCGYKLTKEEIMALKIAGFTEEIEFWDTHRGSKQ